MKDENLLIVVVLLFLIMQRDERAPVPGYYPANAPPQIPPHLQPAICASSASCQDNPALDVAMAIPGAGLAYRALKPVEDHVLLPIVNKLNSALGINKTVYNADGSTTVIHGPEQITYNTDGTVSRGFHAQLTYGQAWHKTKAVASTVGSAVEHAGSSTWHAIKSIF